MREYIWLPEAEIAPTIGSRTAIDRPLAVVEAVNTATPATYWVSVDHLNRPVKMTNSTKASVWDAAVWDAVWQPWGGAHSFTGAATLDARFPGRWFQAETGLHYNWHRSYDPTLGRYTQPDPLGFVDGPSVYGYASSSSLMFVDMLGLSPDQKPSGPVILDKDGKQIYPPKEPPPTKTGIEVPEKPKPEPLPSDRRRQCDLIFSNCLKKCQKFRWPSARAAGLGYCAIEYSICRLGSSGA